MTPLRTTRSILTEWTPHVGSVPSISKEFVCDYCLGPVTKFPQCFGCYSVFHKSGAPRELRDRVVPMTTALNPSRWYSALSNYKKLQPDLRAVLVSVAHHFISSRSAHIRDALRGEPDIITVVPSKRGIPYAQQPLQTALQMVKPIAAKLRQTLAHLPAELVPHQGYNAGAFGPGPTDVRGKRVLLVEDSWVSGATATSAAGALISLGALEVLLTPVARVIAHDFWPDDHPYRVAMRQPWMPDSTESWPR